MPEGVLDKKQTDFYILIIQFTCKNVCRIAADKLNNIFLHGNIQIEKYYTKT